MSPTADYYFMLNGTMTPKCEYEMSFKDENGEFVAMSLFSGEKYCGPTPVSLSTSDERLVEPLGFTSILVPIVHKTMADVIKAHTGSQVQFVPTLLTDKLGLSIMNVMNVVECIDTAKSAITYYPPDYYRRDVAGKPMFITRLVLNSDQLAGYEIFRVKYWSHAILVSAKLAEAILSSLGSDKDKIRFHPVESTASKS